MTLLTKTATELLDLLQKGEVTAETLVRETFDQIERVDSEIHSFLLVTKEEALERAKQLDALPTEQRGPLFGLPVGVKDNIVTKNIETTAASKMLEGFIPVYDATVVQKLEEAGAIVVGKLNLDEFAMGATTENSAYQQTKNPWNVERVPGGSSGGSAAAVAAGEVPFALGTDTGGSIRQPAAYCGIVGMKPTYGRVSRLGLVAFASSLDQIGPMTKTVEDNARILEVIAGADDYDTTSSEKEVPSYVDGLSKDLTGVKVALPVEFIGERVQQEVKDEVLRAVEQLKALGATVEEVSLPTVEYASEVYYVISSAEASSNLARYDGIHYGRRATGAKDLTDLYRKSRQEGLGHEVKKRVLFGTYALSADYHESVFVHAQRVRAKIVAEIDAVLARYDVIVGPTAATIAHPFGHNVEDAEQLYMNDILTIPANLAGLPAMSVPCGFVQNMPVGLQIIGRHFEEQQVYNVGYAFEQATDFHTKRPEMKGEVEE